MDPSVVAIVVATSVGVATLAGAFAAALLVGATKDDVNSKRGR
ncbi:MAG: hypothetical protein ABIZ57_07665 [Candidatus Limnocylindria bacterium]